MSQRVKEGGTYDVIFKDLDLELGQGVSRRVMEGWSRGVST
jgi:hypothetical protein